MKLRLVLVAVFCVFVDFSDVVVASDKKPQNSWNQHTDSHILEIMEMLFSAPTLERYLIVMRAVSIKALPK